MHHPTDEIAHTTAFVTPVVEHWLDDIEVVLKTKSYVRVEYQYHAIWYIKKAVVCVVLSVESAYKISLALN